jgi:acyl carrier protein
MTPDQSAIAERVRRIVANHQGVSEVEISVDTPLFRNLASLDMEELIMAFEDEFGCRIPDGDAANLHTVGDVIRYLEEKGKRAEGE